MQLTRRQVEALRRVQAGLAAEPDAEDRPETDDARTRAALDSWVAGVISSKGRIEDSSLDELLYLERDASGDRKGGSYVARMIDIVMPYRQEQVLRAPLAAVVEQHCSRRGYRIRTRTPNYPGGLAWTIQVPHREGEVDLCLDGELFELTFPGGYLWIDFTYSPEDDSQVLDEQLRVLDAYAHTDTRVVTVKRALRRPRTELHLSNGTKLWRRGRTFGSY